VPVVGEQPAIGRQAIKKSPMIDLSANKLNEARRLGIKSDHGDVPAPVGFNIQENIVRVHGHVIHATDIPSKHRHREQQARDSDQLRPPRQK